MPAKDLRPDVPSTLKQIAASRWCEIIDDYWPEKIKSSDLPLLEIYCANYQRWVEAEENLSHQDRVLEGSNGNQYPNPYVGIGNKAMQIITKLSKELGLTTLYKKKAKGSPDKTVAFTPRSRN